MAKSQLRENAERFYKGGVYLYDEGRYEEALYELRLAEDAFRRLDIPGHPLGHHLANGVSGLANALFLAGKCHQHLGDSAAAVTCYETGMINARFERQQPFRKLLDSIREDFCACYEKKLQSLDPQTLANVLNGTVEIDTTFLFPFSLSEDAIPPARLYELAPDRFIRFKAFYERAKREDISLRMADRRSDDAFVHRISVSTWAIIVCIWLFYGFIVARTLFSK